MINTMFVLLLALRFVFEKSYQAAMFYRNHMHETVVEYSIKALALVITIVNYTIEMVRYLITNQEAIRNRIGSAFVYESPDTIALN